MNTEINQTFRLHQEYESHNVLYRVIKPQDHE